MIYNLATLPFGTPVELDISKKILEAVDNIGTKIPYKWQEEFDRISNKQYVSIEASTGAGKSLAIKMSSYRYLHANQKNKVIITVPQKSIGAEFESEKFLLDGKAVYWPTPKNFCAVNNKNSIDGLINFLKLPTDNLIPASRIIVVCNPTLVAAYEKLKNENVFNNLMLVIDETHHVSTAEDSNGNYNANGLGKVFLAMINNKSNSLLTVTATQFRSDETTIIPTEYKNLFEKFFVPFYRVMEECRKVTKTVQFNYLLCEKTFIKGIKECYIPGEKTIIFIHSKLAKVGANSQDRLTYKHDSVKQVVKSLGKIVKTNKAIGCYTVKNKNKTILVADLVSKDMQQNASEYIKQCKKNKTYKVDTIIAMNMFKEGCDYPPLAHCIIHGVRNSYGDIVQMAGRVVRDYDGKPTAKITLVLPNDLNTDNVNEVVQKHLKFILCAMSMIDIFMPVVLRIKQNTNNRVLFSGGGNIESPLNVIGDFVQQTEFKEDAIVEWSRQTKDDPDAKISWNKRLDIMTDICEKNLSDEHKDKAGPIAEQILKETALVLASRNTTFNMDDITDEYLKKIDTTQFLYTFASDVLRSDDIKTFRDNVLRIMGGKKKTKEEHRLKYIECGGWENWIEFYKKNEMMGYFGAPGPRFGMTQAEWTEYCFGKMKTKEEHREKFIECGGVTKWFKFVKTEDGKHCYLVMPWISFDMTQAEWTDYCFGKKMVKTKEEHREKFIECGGNYKKWKKFFNKFGKDLGYFAAPWGCFDMSNAEWTEYCFGKKKTKEEHREKFIECGGVTKWFTFVRPEDGKSDYNIYPWEKFNMSQIEWTEYCFGKKKTKEEHREKFIECGGVTKWFTFVRTEGNKCGYLHYPWQSFKMSQVKWAEYCFGKKVVKTKEEHREKFIECCSKSNWIKFYTNEGRSNGYIRNPWQSFDMKYSEWVEYCLGENKAKK